jgi:flagellar hook assembly protein FlgD
VKLSVYDASGKLVRELVSAVQNPSNYSVAWDGRDDSGRRLANGVYVLRLDADRTVTQQILMLH